MKPNIWIFSLEPIESRYTCQWYDHIPSLLNESFEDKYNVINLSGIQNNTAVTPGAFLNFSDTNYWKSTQLCEFLTYFNKGLVTPDDQFLLTDAWNPVLIQLKYMNDLLNYCWKFHGLWHAGAYDSQDFLGRLVGNKPWVINFEKSLFEAFDHNYFATDYHIELFVKERLLDQSTNSKRVTETKSYLLDNKKVVQTGWPMEYMYSIIRPYQSETKRNLILFPHRVSTEKQPEIFYDLKEQLPEYEFVVCQEQNLTKHEYHTLLGQAKIVFSANLQETLGISTCIEGPLTNAIPLAPDRLSYTEIFNEYHEFLYPSNWTSSWNDYLTNRDLIKNKIIYTMNNFESLLDKLNDYIFNQSKKYFCSDELLTTINNFKR